MRFPFTPRSGKIRPQFVAPLSPCNLPIDRCRVSREQASKRILIIRTGAHGDILMGTPLLAALRKAWPDAHLTWLVERKEREAIDTNPHLDEVLLWDSAYWKGMVRRGLFPLWLIRALQFQQQLRRRRYDILISFLPEEWPLLLRGVGAPVTIGVFDTFRQFSRATHTSRRARLYTHAYTVADLPRHRTDQYLLPLRALGLPEPGQADKQMQLGFTDDDAAAVERFLAEHALNSGRPLVALAPMTTWPSRCWPAERYAALGDALAAQENCSVVLLGSAQERAAVEAVAAQMQARPALALGALSFRQMAALIARAALLVSGDTGPMHVAATVETPFVALFGPTPVAGRAPLFGRGLTLMRPVPCGPCDQKVCPNSGDDHMRCMRLLSVDDVLQAARGLLEQSVEASRQ